MRSDRDATSICGLPPPGVVRIRFKHGDAGQEPVRASKPIATTPLFATLMTARVLQ